MRPLRAPAWSVRAADAGYSFIELMIVLSLVVIMATMATPVFKDMVGRYRLNAASAATASRIAQARSIAMARGTYTRVVFTKVDTSPSDMTEYVGAFRIEQYVCPPALLVGTQPPTCQWQLVDDPVVGRVISGLDKDCINSVTKTEYNEYCVNIGFRFPWVSLTGVDSVGTRLTASPSDPAIQFGPDGLVINDRGDFALGADAQHIRMVLSSKRKNGKLESRIISLDRAGNVDVVPYVGSGLPTL